MNHVQENENLQKAIALEAWSNTFRKLGYVMFAAVIIFFLMGQMGCFTVAAIAHLLVTACMMLTTIRAMHYRTMR